MNPKEWTVIGISGAISLILIIMLLINIGAPKENAKLEMEEDVREPFMPDRQVVLGTIGPNGNVSKNIPVNSEGVLRGEFRINFKGLADIRYRILAPDSAILGFGSTNSVLLKVSGGSEIFALRMVNSPPIPEDLVGRLVYANYARQQDVAELDLKDSIVIAERGGEEFGEIVRFLEKQRNVAAKDGVMLVVYNNEPDIFLGSVPIRNDIASQIPLVSISREDGLRLKELVSTGNNDVIATITTTDPDFKTDISVPTSRFKVLAYMRGDYILNIHNNGPSYIDATFDYTFRESK